MMPGIEDMFMDVLANKGLDYDEWLYGLEENEQWHVQVY
jgi:hypothetical protein